MVSVVGLAIVKSLLVLVMNISFIRDFIYSVLIIGRLVEINNQFYTLPIHWQQKRLAMASIFHFYLFLSQQTTYNKK
jgi:hypothetical protein